MMVYVVDGVSAAGCPDDAKRVLDDICMMLPVEQCLGDMPDKPAPVCKDDEFSCGDGQCVPRWQACNLRYDCMNGADELSW